MKKDYIIYAICVWILLLMYFFNFLIFIPLGLVLYWLLNMILKEKLKEFTYQYLKFKYKNTKDKLKVIDIFNKINDLGFDFVTRLKKETENIKK